MLTELANGQLIPLKWNVRILAVNVNGLENCQTCQYVLCTISKICISLQENHVITVLCCPHCSQSSKILYTCLMLLPLPTLANYYWVSYGLYWLFQTHLDVCKHSPISCVNRCGRTDIPRDQVSIRNLLHTTFLRKNCWMLSQCVVYMLYTGAKLKGGLGGVTNPPNA